MCSRILAQFKNEEGVSAGAPFHLPLEATQESLHILCNTLLENVTGVTYTAIIYYLFVHSQEEETPYEFYVHGIEIQGTINEALSKANDSIETERVLDIIYHPQALFRVRTVTRCTSSIPG